VTPAVSSVGRPMLAQASDVGDFFENWHARYYNNEGKIESGAHRRLLGGGPVSSFGSSRPASRRRAKVEHAGRDG